MAHLVEYMCVDTILFLFFHKSVVVVVAVHLETLIINYNRRNITILIRVVIFLFVLIHNNKALRI